MNLLGYALGAGVLVSLAGIAVSDARRMTIPPPLLAGLLGAGMGWLSLGGGFEAVGASLGSHGIGAAAGLGVPAAVIIWAEMRGRRWPIYPGDALLLGALGAILGVRGLLWAVTAGSAAALLHRVCIQRKRGRPVTSGYLPAGPGFAVGAALVFVALNTGAVWAGGETAGGTEAARIQATELVAVPKGLPQVLTGKPLDLQIEGELPFPALAARIGEAAGLGVEVEERQGRLAGGGAQLPDPGELELGGEKTLGAILDDVAKRAGYAWEWMGGKIVFYRYWDKSWPVPASFAAVPVKKEPEGLFAWLGRLLTGGDEVSEAQPAVPDAEAGGAAVTGDGTADVSVPPVARADGEPEEAEGTETPRKAEGNADGKNDPTGTETKIVTEAPPTTWEVDPVAQKTVRGVLEDWAERAKWRIAWRSKRDFYVGASATFKGEFLAAVDKLLSDPQVSRALVVRAHSNRYLVVEGAGR